MKNNTMTTQPTSPTPAPGRTAYILEPINDGETFQITTGEQSGFSVLAESEDSSTASKLTELVHRANTQPELIDVCEKVLPWLKTMLSTLPKSSPQFAIQEELIAMIHEALSRAEGRAS